MVLCVFYILFFPFAFLFAILLHFESPTDFNSEILGINEKLSKKIINPNSFVLDMLTF